MKKHALIYGSILSLVALFFLFGSAARAATFTGDDFDSGAINGELVSPWVNGSGGNYGGRYNAGGYSGSGAIFGRETYPANSISYLSAGTSTLSQLGSIRIKYLQTASSSAQTDGFRINKTDTTYKWRFERRNDGYFYVKGAADTVVKVGTALNQWYLIQWEYSSTNDTIRFKIDSDAWTPYLAAFTTGNANAVYIQSSAATGTAEGRFIVDDLNVNSVNAAFHVPTEAETCSDLDQSTASGWTQCAFRRLGVWLFYPSADSIGILTDSVDDLKTSFPFRSFFDITDELDSAIASTTFANDASFKIPMIRETATGSEIYMLPVISSSSMAKVIGQQGNAEFRLTIQYLAWGIVVLIIILVLI